MKNNVSSNKQKDNDFKNNRFSKHPVASSLMILFFLSVLIEVILRIANPDILEFAYNFRQVYKYHDNWRTDFEPNTSSLLRLKDSSGSYFFNFIITVNEFGFRTYDRKLDYNLVRGENEKIIHTIGDSFTMGWGVNYEASYPAILEFMAPSDYRVLNLGLNGYGTIGATEKSLEISKVFFPDIVIYLATENDYVDDDKASTYSGHPYLIHRVFDLLNFFRQHTYSASSPFALKWWLYFRHSISVTDNDFPKHKTSYISIENDFKLLSTDHKSDPNIGANSKNALLRYNNYLSQRKVPFIVLSHGVGKVSRDINAFCKEHGISSYLVEVPKDLKLIKEGHFNQIGNYKMALLIYKILKARNLI